MILYISLFLSLASSVGCSRDTINEPPPPPSEEELLEKQKRREKRKLKFIAEDVSCLRGKEFSPVPFLEHQSTEDFRTFMQKDIDKELNNEKGTVFSYTLKGLRLLTPDFDLRQSYIDMLAEQAAAYYDPTTDGFYIVAQMKGLMIDATIAHELQHALQDQHTDTLSKYTSESFHSFDHEMATRFLVEGEATLIGNAWLMQNMGSMFGLGDSGKNCLQEDPTDEQQKFWFAVHDFIKDTAFATREQNTNMPKWMKILISMSMPMDKVEESLKNLPIFHYYLLNTPYLRGSWYAYVKFQQSGWKRSGLDNLFTHPPQTTEQTLHPEQEHPPPPPTPPATVPSEISKGWKPHQPDTMGELGIVIWLIEHGMREQDAYRAAEGWNGDRVQVWTPIDDKNAPTKYAISWNMLWDKADDANKARQAIQNQIKASFVDWESSSWAADASKGKEVFTYTSSKGSVEWDQNQLVLWWGF